MHNRLIILTDAYRESEGKEKKGMVKIYKNSKEVRDKVQDYLYEEGFTDQREFCSGPSDGLAIGGRWSGVLTEYLFNPILWKACHDKLWEEKEKTGVNRWKSNVTLKQKAYARKMFNDFFPKYKGLLPFHRDSLCYFGEEDDAMIVTKLLWTRFIKKLVRDSEGDFYQDPIIYLQGSVIDECKEEDVVNKMYAVVVDYHN